MELSEDGGLLIPIRMVESLVYCPRQAWYRFVLGDDPLNVHMERGLRRHDQFGEAATDGTEGEVFRHVPVQAPVLGVQGVLDEVIVGTDGTTVTEYKSARLAAEVWEGVAMQVVVQVLALREQAAAGRWFGPPLAEPVRARVYFAESRRYREVALDSEAERLAREVVRRARLTMELATPPPGNVGPRCRNCQHEPICLPFESPLWVAEGGRREEEGR
jgi:CRISPR-associated protein Cas4